MEVVLCFKTVQSIENVNTRYETYHLKEVKGASAFFFT